MRYRSRNSPPPRTWTTASSREIGLDGEARTCHTSTLIENCYDRPRTSPAPRPSVGVVVLHGTLLAPLLRIFSIRSTANHYTVPCWSVYWASRPLPWSSRLNGVVLTSSPELVSILGLLEGEILLSACNWISRTVQLSRGDNMIASSRLSSRRFLPGPVFIASVIFQFRPCKGHLYSHNPRTIF